MAPRFRYLGVGALKQAPDVDGSFCGNIGEYVLPLKFQTQLNSRGSEMLLLLNERGGEGG